MGYYTQTKLVSDLTLYQEPFPGFMTLNNNPAKLFGLLSDLHNELNFMRKENQELAKENGRLRSRFTCLYIANSIESRGFNSDCDKEEPLIDQNLALKIQQTTKFRSQEVSTQTQISEPEPFRAPTNVTIRVEIVTNSNKSPSPPDLVKIIDVQPDAPYLSVSQPMIDTAEFDFGNVTVEDKTNEANCPNIDSEKSNDVTVKPESDPPETVVDLSNLSRHNMMRKISQSPNQSIEKDENTEKPAFRYKEMGATTEGLGAVQLCQPRKRNTIMNMFSRSKTKIQPEKLQHTKMNIQPNIELPHVKNSTFQSSWSRNRQKKAFDDYSPRSLLLPFYKETHSDSTKPNPKPDDRMLEQLLERTPMEIQSAGKPSKLRKPKTKGWIT